MPNFLGGLDTLAAMEKIETDNKDKPIEDILIQKASVFVDPFAEVDEILAQERAKEMEIAREKEKKLNEKKKKTEAPGLKAYSKGIGKFINPNLKKEARKFDDEDLNAPVTKKKKELKSSLSDFSAW